MMNRLCARLALVAGLEFSERPLRDGAKMKISPVQLTLQAIALGAFLLQTGCTSVNTALAKATLAVSPVPMQKNMRSSFHPYTNENGEHFFMIRNMFIDGEDPAVNNRHYQQWLSEWLTQYQYCKNGYEMISNQTERFAGSQLNANLGGFLVSHGRCKARNDAAQVGRSDSAASLSSVR